MPGQVAGFSPETGVLVEQIPEERNRARVTRFCRADNLKEIRQLVVFGALCLAAFLASIAGMLGLFMSDRY
jgi:hypothetical protein